MDIRSYCDEHWPAFQRFVHEHWRAEHPYTERSLHDWQFAGFGGLPPATKLLIHDDEIVGVLGGIPGEYFVDGEVMPGVVFDLWVVRPELRNRALGLMLMRELEREYRVTCCLGVNANVVRYYTGRGYHYGECLHRYVVPLEAAEYTRLLATEGDPPGQPDAGVLASLDELGLDSHLGIPPACSVDPAAMEELYSRTVERVFRFGLHRSAEFWRWRYLRSAGFKYLFFGDAKTGFIVARIERVISRERPELDGMAVLRLIELLPADADSWSGGGDGRFIGLLGSVLRWFRDRGCIMADFQNSSDRLGPLLRAAGFVDIAVERESVLARTPNMFQPLRPSFSPINFVWRLEGLPAVTQQRDIYFVKSDDGMDRPNVWPQPPGYDGDESCCEAGGAVAGSGKRL